MWAVPTGNPSSPSSSPHVSSVPVALVMAVVPRRRSGRPARPAAYGRPRGRGDLGGFGGGHARHDATRRGLTSWARSAAVKLVLAGYLVLQLHPWVGGDRVRVEIGPRVGGPRPGSATEAARAALRAAGSPADRHTRAIFSRARWAVSLARLQQENGSPRAWGSVLANATTFCRVVYPWPVAGPDPFWVQGVEPPLVERVDHVRT